MQECEAYLELIGGMLDDALTPEEQAKLEAHLAQCPDCRALVQDLQNLSGDLSGLAPVPEGFADKVMERVSGQEQTAPARTAVPEQKAGKNWRRRLLPIGALAACCVLVLGVGRFALGMMRCGGAAPENAYNQTGAPAEMAGGESDAVAADAAQSEAASLPERIWYQGGQYLSADTVTEELPEGAVFVGQVPEEEGTPSGLAGCPLYMNPEQPDAVYVEQPDGSYSCWTKE